MLRGLRSICVNNQTPLVRFLRPSVELAAGPATDGEAPTLDHLVAGKDYVPTSGGVVQVVLPLLKKLLSEGDLDRAYWLSLSPQGPPRYLFEGIEMIGVTLSPPELRAYTQAKEKLWNLIHGLPTRPLGTEDFVAFAQYNWECTRRMFELAEKVDLFYVHDFQQLMTGSMIGLAAPAVLRWHIPMAMTRTPPAVRRYILHGLQGFDAVIVSCRRDLEALIRFGFSGKARQLYPTIDPASFGPVPAERSAELRKRWRIPEGAPVVLNVGRMDPMKGQDTLLRALPPLVERYPELRCVLVGNGSFTGAAKGGLGGSKSAMWRAKLEGIVRELGLGRNVVFAGHVSHEELCAAYAASDLFVLPSPAEGFGLVVGEAWLYQRPAVVSTGAGISELISEEVNGFTFPPGDTATLGQALSRLLGDPGLRAEMGRKGRDAVSACAPDRTVGEITQVLRGAREAYR
jgi:glycosyltransferase involved in cell wall biosynthesis